MKTFRELSLSDPWVRYTAPTCNCRPRKVLMANGFAAPPVNSRH